MNGQVIPGTPFAVDFWKIRECPTVKLFFLTHLHGDHTVGLTSSWHQPIYCSPVTGQMLIDLYGIEEDFVRPLGVDTCHMIPLGDTQEIMTVTVLNANHCPGSVMYIFEGYFGKILHTGDFRYHKDMVNSSNSHFFSNIDTMYLDNTYCNINCVFPPREEVTASIVALIKSKPNHSFVIGMRNLGKEDLLVSIAQHCDEWVSLSMNMYNRSLFLGLPSVFLCEDESCRIRTVKFHEVSKKNITAWNKCKPTIAILPTSLYAGLDHNPFCNMDMVHVYPYSDHSSYSELMKFVEKVKPGKIIPIVPAKTRGPFGSDISLRADMNCFSHLLSKDLKLEEPRPIPLSVRQWMTRKGVPFINSLSRANRNQRPKPKLFKKPSMRTRGVVFESSDDDQGTNQDKDSKENEEETNQDKDSKENEEERTNTIKPSADLICYGSIGTDIQSESLNSNRGTPPSLWNSHKLYSNARHTSTSENKVSGKQKKFTVIEEKLISSSNEIVTSKTQSEPSISCLVNCNEINVLCRKRMAADDLISKCSSANSDSESHNLTLQRKKKCLPLSPLLKDGTGSCGCVEIQTFNLETKEKPLSPLVSDGNCTSIAELQDKASGEVKAFVNAGADCSEGRTDSVRVVMDMSDIKAEADCSEGRTESVRVMDMSDIKAGADCSEGRTDSVRVMDMSDIKAEADCSEGRTDSVRVVMDMSDINAGADCSEGRTDSVRVVMDMSDVKAEADCSEGRTDSVRVVMDMSDIKAEADCSEGRTDSVRVVMDMSDIKAEADCSEGRTDSVRVVMDMSDIKAEADCSEGRTDSVRVMDMSDINAGADCSEGRTDSVRVMDMSDIKAEADCSEGRTDSVRVVMDMSDIKAEADCSEGRTDSVRVVMDMSDIKAEADCIEGRTDSVRVVMDMSDIKAGADCSEGWNDSVRVMDMSDVNQKIVPSTCLDSRNCSQNLTSTTDFNEQYLNFLQKKKLNDSLTREVIDISILSGNEGMSEECRNKGLNRKTRLMSKSPIITSVNRTSSDCRNYQEQMKCSKQKNSHCSSMKASQKEFLWKKVKSSNLEQDFFRGGRLDSECNSCTKPENATLATSEKNVKVRKRKSRERLSISETFDVVISEPIQGLSEKSKKSSTAESASFPLQASCRKKHKEKSLSSFTISDHKKQKADSILKSPCPRPSSKLTEMTEQTKLVNLNSTKNSVPKVLNGGKYFVSKEKEKMKALINFVCVEPIFSVKPLVRKINCSVKTPGVPRDLENGVFPIRKYTGNVSTKQKKDKAFVWEVPG